MIQLIRFGIVSKREETHSNKKKGKMASLAGGGSNSKRHQGTYRAIARIPWTTLLENEFGSPDWQKLYPINLKNGLPVGLLSPRMACKLFHDSLLIIKRGEDSTKYIQDRIPEIAHKCYRKKQWRKQFFECMRRVSCRLAAGLGFRPNCVGEDVFVHVILNSAFDLGWRRIEEFINPLPETQNDKDWAKVARLANEDIGSLLKGNEAAYDTKTKKIDATKLDVKGWFKCYANTTDSVFDHVIKMEEDEMEDWSLASGSSTSSSGNQSNSPSNAAPSPLANALSQGFNNISVSPLKYSKGLAAPRARSDSNMSDISNDENTGAAAAPASKP